MRPIDAVREASIGVDAVELAGRLVIDRRPGVAAVEADLGAAIVALDHAIAVGRVDPDVVVVAVRGVDLGEVGAAVSGFPHGEVGDIDGVAMARVGEDMGVVPGPVHQVAAGLGLDPAGAVVVGAIQAAFFSFRLDQRPNAAGLRRGHGHADLAQRAGRKSLVARNFGPAVAAIGGLEQPAARATGGDVPEVAPGLPDRGVEDARIAGVHRHVHGAAIFVAIENFRPVLAAIVGAIDTARLVRAEDVAEGSDIDDVGVGRVDQHAADMLGVLQADIAPGQAGIGALIDAVAIGHVEPDGGLAHAGIDHVGVRARHRDRTNSRGLQEAVGDAAPVEPAITGLPDAAGTGAEIEGHLVVEVAGHRHHTPATRRTDAAPFQAGERCIGGKIVHGEVPGNCTSRQSATVRRRRQRGMG